MKKLIRTLALIFALTCAVSAVVLPSSADSAAEGYIKVTETVEVRHTLTGITYYPQIVFKASTNPFTGEKHEDKTPWLKTGEYVATSTAVPYYPLYDNYVKVKRLNAAGEYRIVFYDASGAWIGYTKRAAVPAGEVCINDLEIESGSGADAVAYKVVSYAPGMTAALWKKAQRYASQTVCSVRVTAEIEYYPGQIRRETIISALEYVLFGHDEG